MKLSIYHIFGNSLFEKCTLITAEGNFSFDLTGVRLYAPDEGTLSENLLYLIHPDQLKLIAPDPSLHFLCLGELSKEIADYQYHSVIVMPEITDRCNLLSKVQDIFDQYHLWGESIQDAILNRKSLQSIFDLCSLVLKNPIALFDSNQALLLKSGHLPENLGGTLWDFVLKHGYTPKERISESTYLNRQLQTNPLPIFFQSNDQYRSTKRLIAGIHLQDMLFGCIALSDISAPITDLEYANVHLIQQFIQCALLNSEEYKVYRTKTPWYLVRLLKGNKVEKNVVSYNLTMKGKRMNDPFFLWCFIPCRSKKAEAENEEESILSMPSFSKYFNTDFVFYHENQIVVIDYHLDHYHDESFHSDLLDLLNKNSFIGVYSMIFRNIMEIHHPFIQCQIVLEDAASENAAVYSFQKNYALYLLKLIKRNSPSDSLLHPDIKLILNSEKKYEVELLRCLEAFIMQGQNISATANQLFIHRHTVIYRLNLISEITGIVFKELDEDILFHILLTCRLLLSEIT